jgi:hypothetical protein
MIDPSAVAVAKELDGLPLALATAGAYLNQVTTSFQDYLRLYKASWLKLHQTTPELSSYEDRQLYTTWKLSYDHIKRQNELSARLLCLWAYFDSKDLWFELLREKKLNRPGMVRSTDTGRAQLPPGDEGAVQPWISRSRQAVEYERDRINRIQYTQLRSRMDHACPQFRMEQRGGNAFSTLH